MTRARDIANLGNNTTNLETLDTLYGDNVLTGRNLIINGAFTVAQRGTSATVANGSPLTVDRFSVHAANFAQASFTESQSTTVPSGEGFANSLKVVCGGTAETTLDATDHLYIRYRGNEGQDVQHLQYGTSNAKKVTASFWVRSSVTGDYAVMVYTNAGIGGGAVARSQTKTYTINSADTWEYKTITFDGDGASGNTLANDNTAEWQVYFTLASGTTQKATDGTSWGAYATGKFSYGQTADLSAVANSDWYITGVQLEVGETATPFEHRSYGDELALCQRYYCNVASFSRDNFGQLYSSTQGKVGLKFPVIMRAAATVTANSPFTSMLEENGVAVRTPSSAGVNYNSKSGCIMSFNVTGTAGNGLFVRQCPSDTTIEADAEL